MGFLIFSASRFYGSWHLFLSFDCPWLNVNGQRLHGPNRADMALRLASRTTAGRALLARATTPINIFKNSSMQQRSIQSSQPMFAKGLFSRCKPLPYPIAELICAQNTPELDWKRILPVEFGSTFQHLRFKFSSSLIEPLQKSSPNLMRQLFLC